MQHDESITVPNQPPQLRADAIPQRLRGQAPAPGHPWLVAAAGFVLLHLTQPLAWGSELPGWWFAPAGIGLALVAWLGPRALVLVAADVLLVSFQAQLAGTPLPLAPGWPMAAYAGWSALLEASELGMAWWCYHRLARGTRRLGDPRSATLFLLLVPGLVVGLFAPLHALPLWLHDPGHGPLWQVIRACWVSRALGILALTPPLLVVLTPWLLRRHLIHSEPPGVAQAMQREGEIPSRLAWGDWVEIGGLALGAGTFGLILAVVSHQRDMDGWQLWGGPLLLIVWASLRQGLRGGTVVAAAAAIMPLTLATLLGWETEPHLLMQGNLLAQCGTALLAASSASWIRTSEARYRQVVGHIPVVLYSVRVIQPGIPGKRAPVAAVTFVSPACRDLLRCAPEELLGDYEQWLDRVDPQDHEVVLAALAQLSRQNQPVTCEYRLAKQARKRKSGEPDSSSRPWIANAKSTTHGSKVISLQSPPAKECWVRDTMVPEVGVDSQLEGWQGVATDITEQRALSTDLRRTTSMFHALVANLPAGVFFVQGPSGRPILVNARARQLLGQREDPGADLDHFTRIYRLFRPDGTPYPTSELPVFTALRRGLSSMRDDIVVHRPDGKRLPLITWAAPIDLGGYGKSDAAVWVFEDLTALHQAEAARHESAARLRAVVETRAEGLIVEDRTGTIVEATPAACAMLGLPPDQLQGRS